MEKVKIVQKLYEQGFLEDHEEILISNGFEDAIIGVTTVSPKSIVYDYYKAIDLIMKEDSDIDLDEAVDWLDDHTSVDLGKSTPIFIKLL
jgi:hypothetical protein